MLLQHFHSWVVLVSRGNSHHVAFQKEVQNRGSSWRYHGLNQEKRWAKEGPCEVLMDVSLHGSFHVLRGIPTTQLSVLQGGIFEAPQVGRRGIIILDIFQGCFFRDPLVGIHSLFQPNICVSHFSPIALRSGVATRGAECRPWGASAISRCRCWQVQAGC